MKNFTLGCLLVILTSATISTSTNINTNMLTVKPATPKSIVIFKDRSEYCQEKIKSYYRKGYIVKSTVSVGKFDNILVVMERY